MSGGTSGRGGALPGSGFFKGLAITLRTMTRRSVTRQYPDVKPDLPPRSRGAIGLLAENCTVCMLCARECPDWCIYIDSHKETVPPPPDAAGGRPRSRNQLDRFAIDFSLCMYCGICIEACPFDALFWSPEFEYASYDIGELTHEMDLLREWMWTVPPPPPHDEHAPPTKEQLAAAPAAPIRDDVTLPRSSRHDATSSRTEGRGTGGGRVDGGRA
jgi:NADH-quinone oxidoreductase subunit I